MSATTPHHQRAKLAGLHRQKASATQIADAKRDLAAANIEAYIERIVAAAPPLTDEQRGRLARIICSPLPAGDCDG